MDWIRKHPLETILGGAFAGLIFGVALVSF